MNNVHDLVIMLRRSYIDAGSSDEKASEQVLLYLENFLDRLAKTNPSIGDQVKRRIDTIKKLKDKPV